MVLLTLLFAVIYTIVVTFGSAMGMGNFYFYLGFSFLLMFIQFMIGSKVVEWSMRIRYVGREEFPKLYAMIEEQARQARLPMPKVCVAQMSIPNAFAFGRGRSDGRVCVTRGIMELLSDEELRAVIGHELTHIRNRDVATITILSVIPMVLYRLAWHFLWYGGGYGGRRDDRGGGHNAALLGLVAFVFYFVTNLLVLYGSRIREYFADKGSVELGNRPEALASALYKLVYGSARTPKAAMKDVEGLKAFFINDPSRAMEEIRELAQLDLNRSGTIDSDELALLRSQQLKLSIGDRLMEALSTHPNMLKRIQHLSQLS